MAIMSQRVSPPKMLTKMVFTLGSFRMMLKEVFTVSLVALPPVSRKLAHFPPRSEMASTVFIARPAPLTVRFGQIRNRQCLMGGLPSVPMLPALLSLDSEGLAWKDDVERD